MAGGTQMISRHDWLNIMLLAGPANNANNGFELSYALTLRNEIFPQISI